MACNLSVSDLSARSSSTFGSKKPFMLEKKCCSCVLMAGRWNALLSFQNGLNCERQSTTHIFISNKFWFASKKGYYFRLLTRNHLQEVSDLVKPLIQHSHANGYRIWRISTPGEVYVVSPVTSWVKPRSPHFNISHSPSMETCHHKYDVMAVGDKMLTKAFQYYWCVRVGVRSWVRTFCCDYEH